MKTRSLNSLAARSIATLVFLVVLVGPYLAWKGSLTGALPPGPTTDAEIPKQTGADEFALYHEAIRTYDGDEKPAYRPNYQLRELVKARALAKTSFRAIPWKEHGPANVGGRTRAIVVDVTDTSGDTWLAASVSGGIWKTVNAGQSWTHLTPELPNLAFGSLIQAPSEPDVLYAGTGEGFFNGDASVGAGIFRSTDRGATWTQLPSTAESVHFRYVNLM